MSVEGLTREMANIQGQRTAGIGRAITGAIGTGVQGLQDFSRVRDEDIMQQQLKKGKQGVLDMAKAENLDANQMNILNSMMAGPLNKDVLGKMAVYIQGVKDANEKKAAGVAQKERLGGFAKTLAGSQPTQGVVREGETPQEFESRSVAQGLSVTKKEVLGGVKSEDERKFVEGLAKGLEEKGIKAKPLTENQKDLRRRFDIRMANTKSIKEAGVIKQAMDQVDQFAGIGSVLGELNTVLNEESFSTLTDALNPSVANVLQKGLQSVVGDENAQDVIATAEYTSKVQSLIAQVLLTSMKSIKGAASDRDVQIVSNSLSNPTVTDARKLRNALFNLSNKIRKEHKVATTGLSEQSKLFTGRTKKLLDLPIDQGGFGLEIIFDDAKDFGKKVEKETTSEPTKVDASMSIQDMMKTLPKE